MYVYNFRCLLHVYLYIYVYLSPDKSERTLREPFMSGTKTILSFAIIVMASFDKQETACSSMHASMYASYVGAHLDMKRTVHAVFARCLEKQRVILTHHICCRAWHAPLEAVGVDKIAPALLAHFCCAHLQLSLASHLISR